MTVEILQLSDVSEDECSRDQHSSLEPKGDGEIDHISKMPGSESSEASILDEIFHIQESKNESTVCFYRQRKYGILVC